jgi:hypothetical protein
MSRPLKSSVCCIVAPTELPSVVTTFIKEIYLDNLHQSYDNLTSSRTFIIFEIVLSNRTNAQRVQSGT